MIELTRYQHRLVGARMGELVAGVFRESFV